MSEAGELLVPRRRPPKRRLILSARAGSGLGDMRKGAEARWPYSSGAGLSGDERMLATCFNSRREKVNEQASRGESREHYGSAEEQHCRLLELPAPSSRVAVLHLADTGACEAIALNRRASAFSRSKPPSQDDESFVLIQSTSTAQSVGAPEESASHFSALAHQDPTHLPRPSTS